MHWKVSPSSLEYYQTRITQLEDNNKRRSVQEAFEGASKKSETGFSVSSSSARESVKRNSASNYGDELKFRTSVQDLFPHSLKERECIVVNGVKLFLSSVSADLLKQAKGILSDQLVRKNVPGNIKYSREDLLNLKQSYCSSDYDEIGMMSKSWPQVVSRSKIEN